MTLETALYNREQFLKEQEHLRSFQEKIDLTMKEVGDDPILRSQVLNQIMLQSLYNIDCKFKGLQQYIKDTKIDLLLSQFINQ
jgi:hypothetical protein